MKTALGLYWHGLGDIIILTPILKQLHKDGFCIDLMCREQAKSSHLLDCCPWIRKLITIENPHRSSKGFDAQAKINTNQWKELSKEYDFSFKCNHEVYLDSKLTMNINESKVKVEDRSLNIFISDDIEKKAKRYIEDNYPNGYIFCHTMIEFHKYHNWDATDWIVNNLPNLPIIDTGYTGKDYMKFDDIHFSFVLAREAKHRVISSSVFVHACDAMGVNIDVVNYGRVDRKVWIDDMTRVYNIRENGKWMTLN